MNLHRSFPFLCRSALRPGESLPSLLVRLAALNAYQSSRMVLSIGQERLTQKDDLARPMHAETYQVLQQLTKLTPSALYQATPHFFARAMTLPGDDTATVSLPDGETAPLLPANVWRSHLRLNNRAYYCPRCLETDAYFRQAWLPWTVAICLEHRCLLVWGCQCCQSFLRLQDVVKGQCPQCQFDLTQAVVSDVTQDAFGLFAQATLLRWFGLIQKGCGQQFSLPNSLQERWIPWTVSMPQQPTAVLYHLVEGVQRSLLRIEPNWHYWHRDGGCMPPPLGFVKRRARLQGLTPEMAYLLAATAFKALVNWPHGFYAFLDVYQERNGRSATHQIPQDFGDLYRLCLNGRWSSPHFQFVQVAFDRYLIENYPLTSTLFSSRRYWTRPQLAAKLPCMPADEAAQRLQMSPRMLNRLVSQRFLVVYKGEIVKKSPHQPDFICRSEVLTLQQQWQLGIPQEDAARLLGVSAPVLIDLVDAGMLTMANNSNERNGNWLLSSRSVTRLLERLMYSARPIREIQPYARPLADMAQALSYYGYRAATVMQLAWEQLIRVSWERQPGPQSGRLWVSTEDLDFRLELLCDDRPFFSRVQAAHQLSVPVANLMEWESKGLISCSREEGLGWQFNRADVERFDAQYVLLREAVSLLDVSTYMVQQWMKKDCLSPISGPSIDGCKRLLFRRSDVEQLCLSRNQQ
jgi:hypothetical protein